MSFQKDVVDTFVEANKKNDTTELIQFMNGLDSFTLRRLVGYFSDGGEYLHPRELKAFWESLSESEKNYYRKLVVTRVI